MTLRVVMMPRWVCRYFCFINSKTDLQPRSRRRSQRMAREIADDKPGRSLAAMARNERAPTDKALRTASLRLVSRRGGDKPFDRGMDGWIGRGGRIGCSCRSWLKRCDLLTSPFGAGGRWD